MNQYSPSLNCVCLGVGAAFEFLSGEKVMPPEWAQKIGLAWLVRLCQEPRRLARRNLYSPVFAAMFFRQLITGFTFGFSSPAGVVPESEGE
jgi:N-acetylglucosaminyldiphosphoundecaprenol N-acetyl-beta-D-mannosaminyltransferase